MFSTTITPKSSIIFSTQNSKVYQFRLEVALKTLERIRTYFEMLAYNADETQFRNMCLEIVDLIFI